MDGTRRQPQRSLARLWVGGVLSAVAVMVGPVLAQPPDSAQVPQRVVIPFDFQSRFDDGRYGRIVGESLWKKLEKSKRFVIPESMLDVREGCERQRIQPGLETSLDEMRRLVRDVFAADVGIWGSVERVAENEWDVYDVAIRVADFSERPPRMIHERKMRTKSVSEIPHLVLQEALDRLSGGADVAASDRSAKPGGEAVESRVSAPSLVPGAFEGTGPRPDGWDPLPPHVTRPEVVIDERRGNHVIRFVIPEDVAATTGVLYYSDYFPVQAGATYRLATRWRTTGAAVKIFVKCYDDLPTKFQSGGDSAGSERREVYRSQQNLQGPANQWNRHQQDFTPKHTRFTPRYGRVMLYGYWPAGTVEFDDVVVTRISP